jgi:hypothetical protein
MRRSALPAAVLSVFVTVFVPSAASAAACTATTLPAPPGFDVLRVTGTDHAGAYVGVVSDGTTGHGVTWQDGQVTALPGDVIPYDMNRSGVISGTREVQDWPDTITQAVLLAPDGAVTVLDAGYSAVAAGVNDRGDAVGWLWPVHPVIYLSVLWPAGGGDNVYLDDDGSGARPSEIDDNGWSVGDPQSPTQWVWDAAGNVRHEFDRSEFMLADIDDGVIAATRVTPDGLSRVFVMDAATGRAMARPGSVGGYALEIEDGIVVGRNATSAMMWRASGAVVLSPPPGAAVSLEATVVNRDGTEAAGISMLASGNQVATLWRCG